MATTLLLSTRFALVRRYDVDILSIHMPKHLPRYLRTHRKRSGLSQKELAQLLGCSEGSKVSRYEGGVRDPSLRALIAYELIFSKAISTLFSGDAEDIARGIRERAIELHRDLDAKPRFTKRIKAKMSFLIDVINPPDNLQP